LKRLITWLGWMALGIVLLTVSFVLVAVRQGWEFDAVLSGSMEPVFNVGGLVVIKPADAREIKTGDVISFKLPGIDTPICHRVIDIENIKGNLFFQTKGDANEEPDIDLVPADSVTGKAILHIPYAGRLAYLAKSGKTPVVFLGKKLPAAVLAVFGMGLLFIGLTLKDTMEDIFRPARKYRREMLKKRREQLLKRRKAFHVR